MRRRLLTIMAVLALVVVSLQAGPKVELKYSGPGNQGNLIWWAPSSGVTNLVMTTNGISVFTVPSGSGIVYTNASLTIARQANLTVTNIVVSTAYPVIGDVTGTVLFVTGVTIQTAPVAAVTNVVLSNP